MSLSSVASLLASNWLRRSWTRRSQLSLPQSTFTTTRNTWVWCGLSLHKYLMIQFKLLTVFSNPGIRLSSEIPDRIWWLWALRSVCSSSDRRILQNNPGTHYPFSQSIILGQTLWFINTNLSHTQSNDWRHSIRISIFASGYRRDFVTNVGWEHGLWGDSGLWP